MPTMSSGHSLKTHPKLWGQCGSYIKENVFFLFEGINNQEVSKEEE